MKFIKKHLILSTVGILMLAVSCVPARKFEDLESKHNQCQEELKTIKSKWEAMESENTEIKAQLERMKKDVTRLENDTMLLGSSLRIKEKQYDKINRLNDEIMKKLEMLQAGSAQENSLLSSQLEQTRKELQEKEDRLARLELELRARELALAEKEKRVKELEGLLAQQKAALKALKDKVAAALTGFEDKGLTVVQKNGKVYVSMEAKLLFPSGSTKVDSKGKEALVKLAKALEGQADLDIVVEGHTDTDKMSSSSHPKNNWELSVLRATAVVQIMMDNSTITPKILSASGRSEYHPVDPSNKAKNRRIEVILTPNLDELFKIIEGDN